MPKDYRTIDMDKSPAVREAVADVRGAMGEAAERRPMPLRFDARPDPDQPFMLIRDMVTNRETRVPMFAYGTVREALNDLFGES